MSTVITRKYQNNNSSSTSFGKWFGRVVYTETISTEDFAKHISTHGSPFDRATIQGVLMSACDCLVELVKDSKRVRLGDLGTFYLSANSEHSDTEEEFTVDKVKKLHLRFRPNRAKSFAFDSKSMRKASSLVDINKLTNSSSESSADGESASDGESAADGESTE